MAQEIEDFRNATEEFSRDAKGHDGFKTTLESSGTKGKRNLHQSLR